MVTRAPKVKVVTTKNQIAGFVQYACEKSNEQFALPRNKPMYEAEHSIVWLSVKAIPFEAQTNSMGQISAMLYEAIDSARHVLEQATGDAVMWFKWYGHFNSEAPGRDAEEFEVACMQSKLMPRPAYTIAPHTRNEIESIKLYEHDGGYLCIATGGEMVPQLFAFWLGQDIGD